MDIFEIMDRESFGKSEVYLYEEDGKWFAYHRSATLLRNSCGSMVKLKKQFHPFYGIMTEKIEVDLNQLLAMSWFVALCSDTEIVLIKTN
jgi:hypothetical protein